MADRVPKKAKGSKKTRKYGRAAKRHQAHIRYTAEKRWIKNQRRQLVRHLSQHPNDSVARATLVALG